MRLGFRLRAELIRNARTMAPMEACGILGGRGDEATRVFQARNVAELPGRFMIHPSDQLAALVAIEERGDQVLAVWHSHPESEAVPSPTDVDLADGWPEPLHLIVSLADPEAPQIRAWRIRAGRAREVAILPAWWRAPRWRFRDWDRDTPEGCAVRSWRLRLLSQYRHRRMMTLNRRIDCWRAVVRDSLGMAPRFYAKPHPDRPWGHGYYDIEQLGSRHCRPWAGRRIRRLGF